MYARPGDTITLVLADAPSGIAEELRLCLADEPETAGADDFALATEAGEAGIAEMSYMPGRYVIDLTLPPDLAPDTYTVVWSWGDGVAADDELLVVGTGPPEAVPDPIEVAWRPSLPEVGALLPRRTKNDDGAYVNTFTSGTEPTGEQAESLITMATGHVASRVGETGDLCNPALTSRARSMAALYAAMLIELTLFPEQVGSNRSPYPQLKDLFDDGMKALIEGVAENCGEGGGGESVGGSGTLASAAFPEATPWGTASW